LNAPTFKLVSALWCLVVAGCVTPADPPSHSGPPEHVTRHRRALLFFDEGRYTACIKSLTRWIDDYAEEHPRLAPSARFFVALAHRKLGDPAAARAKFREFCDLYADVADAEPGGRWRRWAQQELDRLGD